MFGRPFRPFRRAFSSRRSPPCDELLERRHLTVKFDQQRFKLWTRQCGKAGERWHIMPRIHDRESAQGQSEWLPTLLPLLRMALVGGTAVIYQGALHAAPWHGFSDFLIRVDGVPSSLGNYAYDVIDTKLSRSAKPKHILQLCVYADLLERAQGAPPPNIHLVLGDGSRVSIRTADVKHYYQIARHRFEGFVGLPSLTWAEPCGQCTLCRWVWRCEAGLAFDGPSFTVLSPIQVLTLNSTARAGENGFRDGLCEAIGHTVKSFAIDDRAVNIELDGYRITIDLAAGSAGPEKLLFDDGDGRLAVWN